MGGKHRAPDDRFGPVSQAEVRKIMLGDIAYGVGDEVAVHIVGLTRPLHGKIVERLYDGTRARVYVQDSRGKEASVEVDVAQLKPWKE